MTWHLLGKIGDVPAAGGCEFVVDGRIVAVFRGAGEQCYAIDGMCAHQGGPLAQGQLNGTCLTCPWHGWQYDIATGQNLLTNKKMLDVYSVEIRGGELWIELPD